MSLFHVPKLELVDQRTGQLADFKPAAFSAAATLTTTFSVRGGVHHGPPTACASSTTSLLFESFAALLEAAQKSSRSSVIADSLSRDLKTPVPAGLFLVVYLRIDEPDATTEAATERWSTGPCPSLRRPPRRL